MLCFFLLNWETCSQKYSTFRLIFIPGLIFYLEQLTIWDITIVVHIIDPEKEWLRVYEWSKWNNLNWLGAIAS